MRPVSRDRVVVELGRRGIRLRMHGDVYWRRRLPHSDQRLAVQTPDIWDAPQLDDGRSFTTKKKAGGKPCREYPMRDTS